MSFVVFSLCMYSIYIYIFFFSVVIDELYYSLLLFLYDVEKNIECILAYFCCFSFLY